MKQLDRSIACFVAAVTAMDLPDFEEAERWAAAAFALWEEATWTGIVEQFPGGAMTPPRGRARG